MLKKIIIPILFMCLLSSKANASHLMGGEITWECQGNGQYIFTVKLYRDCNGTPGEDSINVFVFNNPLLDSIRLRLFTKKDISPSCNPNGPVISCKAAETQTNWPHSSNIIQGAVQESVFKSYPITLSGVPPPKGWIFTYDECCRNQSIANLVSPSMYGFTLRATMYAYAGRNEGPCFDSSPTFLESPSSVICLGYPFTYNHNASDADLDSLFYSWEKPYSDFGGPYNPPSNPSPIRFVDGYSYDSPLPGPKQNPSNVPATINPATGEISFTSFTQGYFVTVVKVEAWKCGQKVAEICREMQIVLLPCSTNEKPKVTFTSYKDTVEAGELVTFTIHGNDPGVLANGITPQTLTITASGTQFGTSTTTGCLNPPCATLTPAIPISAPTDVSTTFSWQTGCDHVASISDCNPHPNTYTFVFKTQDDFCPAPAQNISTVSITVLAKPVVLSPQPRCIAVLPNGDVTITWTPPSNKAGTFSGYNIYSATSPAGPFVLIDSIFTYLQTTYTHVGATAQTTARFYYIQTRSGCDGRYLSAALDTVNTMQLKVVNPADGTAILAWNAIATPPISSSTLLYKIYMEYPAGSGAWKYIGETKATNYLDSITVCNAQINYRVEMADTTGCISVSSIAGGTFKNVIVPITPALDTLSVDDNNKILLSWNVSTSPDVNAYVIYKQNGGSFIPIDTVYGANMTSFNYPLSSPDLGVEGYLIASLDSCRNIGLLGDVLNTIYLTSKADICKRSAVLNWSAYPTIGSGLAGYRIYQSTAGQAGPYTLIGSVPSTSLTFSAEGLVPNTTYYYKIQAFDLSKNKTATSNRIQFLSTVPTPPRYSYLRNVTVSAPNQVDITCHVDPLASSLNYKVMRSENNQPSTYQEVGVVAAMKTTPIVYSDNTALTENKSYYYKIINVDSCGFDGQETNRGRTILLTATADHVNFTNILRWNDYETWLGNVTSYNIYRGIDGSIDPAPIANVLYAGQGNTYIDDISTLVNGEGIFNYYVEAQEGMGNIYGFTEKSVSNIAEAYQDPIIYIPNAFVPIDVDGANEIFIPVTTFVDFAEYEFSIFDRWGKEIFTTKEVSKGWDGKAGGKPCEFGVYVYLLRYKTSRGEYLEHKGTVTLLR